MLTLSRARGEKKELSWLITKGKAMKLTPENTGSVGLALMWLALLWMATATTQTNLVASTLLLAAAVAVIFRGVGECLVDFLLWWRTCWATGGNSCP